jgi:SAM-dependent methyltransferase
VILSEIHRVLKPGGRVWLYAADPEADVPDAWIERRGFWPPDAYVQAMWRRYSLDAAGWEAAVAGVRALDWGSVDVGSHGFYRRVVAEKSAAG